MALLTAVKEIPKMYWNFFFQIMMYMWKFLTNQIRKLLLQLN